MKNLKKSIQNHLKNQIYYGLGLVLLNQVQYSFNRNNYTSSKCFFRRFKHQTTLKGKFYGYKT